MPISKDSPLYTAYRFHRQWSGLVEYRHGVLCTAQIALNLAREDVNKGSKRHPRGDYPGGVWGGTITTAARDADSQFIDAADLARAGLRLVGYCDEIAKPNHSHIGGIEHTGWFIDADRSDKYRGVVLQFPARNRRAQYIVAYETESDYAGYVIELESNGLPQIHEGEAVTDEYERTDDARDVAYMADQWAERNAEKARDYSESWQLGQRYSEAMDESRGYRLQRRKLMATLAAARRDMGRLGVKSPWVRALCLRICDDIAGLKESAREAYDNAQSILSSNPYVVKDAFNDGAGSNIV